MKSLIEKQAWQFNVSNASAEKTQQLSHQRDGTHNERAGTRCLGHAGSPPHA